MKLYPFCFLFFMTVGNQLFPQTEIFVSKISFSEFQLSNFMSSIALDDETVYFLANNYNLYSYDKKSNNLKYEINIKTKSNEAVFIFRDTIITSLYQDKRYSAIFIDKNSGQITKKLNVPKLKTNPYFINANFFISTCIEDGGQLIGYDLIKNEILWKHFIGHGVTKKFYVQNESVLANFDFDEWKFVNFNGEIEEEIVEEYETNNKMKLLHVFFELSHDNIEITQEFLSEYFLNTEDLKVKTSTKNTVLLSQEKILILGNDSKVISNKELEKIIQLPDEGESEYLEILKIDTDNVWFFYQNLVVNYNFKKNKVIKTYDVTKWNAHQIKLDGNNLWLISATDGQLYHIKLELTKKELDEKAVRFKKEKELEFTKPDPKRVAAEKAAKEKLKQNN